MQLLEGFEESVYTIDKIHSVLSMRQRLRRMGIQEGCVVTIIINNAHYPFLVEVMHNRIAFSRALACEIEVIPYV